MTNPEVAPTRISESTFMEGFLASLALSGCESLVTLNGEHQKRFEKVAEFILERKEQSDLVVQRLPSFRPGPITGEYHEFDGALHYLHRQDIATIRSYGYEVRLQFTEAQIQRRLDKFNEAEQQLLSDLAAVFTAPVVESDYDLG